jgi:hypothetical protein
MGNMSDFEEYAEAMQDFKEAVMEEVLEPVCIPMINFLNSIIQKVGMK